MRGVQAAGKKQSQSAVVSANVALNRVRDGARALSINALLTDACDRSI
jgi:hypothetical protein